MAKTRSEILQIKDAKLKKQIGRLKKKIEDYEEKAKKLKQQSAELEKQLSFGADGCSAPE